MRVVADLVALAGREYSAGDTDAAIYHLLLAAVGAVDLDVNVTDAILGALDDETDTRWLPIRRRELSDVEKRWMDALRRSDREQL